METRCEALRLDKTAQKNGRPSTRWPAEEKPERYVPPGLCFGPFPHKIQQIRQSVPHFGTPPLRLGCAWKVRISAPLLYPLHRHDTRGREKNYEWSYNTPGRCFRAFSHWRQPLVPHPHFGTPAGIPPPLGPSPRRPCSIGYQSILGQSIHRHYLSGRHYFATDPSPLWTPTSTDPPHGHPPRRTPPPRTPPPRTPPRTPPPFEPPRTYIL